ncbi:MAG: hypothetical protein ACOX83_06100 [Candidatus Spyradocola sp.]|jgi:hypothetical protein
MQIWKKRAFALLLALCILWPCCGAAASETAGEAAAGVRIPFGGDARGYDPERDGYYGLLPVRRQTGWDEAGEKIMESAYAPVLVYGGHLYLAQSEIESVLGLSVDTAQQTMRVRAFSRNLFLSAGEREAQFFAGDFPDTYLSLSMTLSAEPLLVDGTFFVPLQDLCILFDLGLHQEKIGEDRFAVVYAPDEGVLDVLAYLYNHSEDCKTFYTGGNLAALGGTSAAAQLAAKLLDGDATAWAALIVSSFGFSEQAYEMLLEQLADDLTLELLSVLPDEAVFTARESASAFSDVLELLKTESELGGNAAVDLDLMQAVFEGRVASDPLVSANDPRWFSETLDRIDALTEQKKALQQFNAGLDGVTTGLATVTGMLATASSYAAVDELSSYAVGELCASKAHLTNSHPAVLNEIEVYANRLHSGILNYSLYDYVSRNWGAWVLDGLSASTPPFKLLQLYTHLDPTISETLDQTRSYQMSLLAIPLQSDVERILRATLQAYPARRAGEEEFRDLTEAAYLYLKVCYLACNHAGSALALSGGEKTAWEAKMDALLEKMAILSTRYGYAPENAYEKHARLLQVDDAVWIEDYVQPAYAWISGEVRQAGSEDPVADAVCTVTGGEGQTCASFSGTPGGRYADVCLPLLEPNGCLPYAPDLRLSATLRFSSPSVEGEDRIALSVVPGKRIDPVETAYLGEAEGVAIASPLGVAGDALSAVTTSNIPQSAGIRELDLPVDAENDYYAASFAEYGGRLYFVEKQPGTSGDVPLRLCRCNLDGSGREVLGDVSWNGMYFLIEDGVLTWEGANPADGSTVYHSLNLETGEWTEQAEPAGSLTRLLFRGYASQGYEGNAAALEPMGEGAWTLYRVMRYDTGPGSLSLSNVTVSESGETSVALVGEPGHIQGVQHIFAIYGGYAYLSAYENGDGILYRLNLSDTNDLQEIGRHPAAGGGDAFFNH